MPTPTKRLEYIDAMRGITMLFVVLGHIVLFSYKELYLGLTYSSVIYQFHMPLFFFISGFVLFKASQHWDLSTSYLFLKNKFFALVVPTLFFLLIYDLRFGLPVWDSLFKSFKDGYWFTFTLFECFILYILCCYFADKFKYGFLFAAGIILATLFINTTLASPILKIVPSNIHNLIGTSQLQYFPFFFLGTLGKKHIGVFLKLTGNGLLMAVVILVFFASILFGQGLISRLSSLMHPMVMEQLLNLIRLFNGLLGIIIVFTFFRKNEALFSKERFVGRSLQYIGRRTLDVYLLHYFFLPRNLDIIGRFFNENVNPPIEFFVTLTIAILVVCLSLCISNILRLSPILEHYLFGVKRKSNV